MNEKIKNIKINWPFKLLFSYKWAQSEIPNDPILKLLSNFQEIQQIMEIKEDTFKFLYFNFEIIQKILYDSENIININSINANFILSNYFYLSLLITYSIKIINFEYSVNIIEAINNQIIEKDNILKEILKSKIVLDLIYNYKQTYNYEDKKDDKILNEMEISCINKIINYKFDKFNFGLNNSIFIELNDNSKYKSKKIDKIYIDVIKLLIEGRNFDNSFEIIKLFDFESIIITNEMFEEIKNKLNDNNDYINYYMITKIEDLLDGKKINFYYILLKYILKNTLYIYKIPFLLKTREIILKIIKSNLEQLISLDISYDINDQIEYLLKTISDSNYFFFKYINCIKDKLIEILKYYQNFLFESKKEDIKLIENYINKNDKIDYKKYLPNFNEAQKINKRNFIIFYLFSQKVNNNVKKESLLKECIEDWKKLEEIIVNKDFQKMTNENKTIIMAIFSDNNNKEILKKIFNEEIYNSMVFFLEMTKNNPEIKELSTQTKSKSIIIKTKENSEKSPIKKINIMKNINIDSKINKKDELLEKKNIDVNNIINNISNQIKQSK